MSFCPTCGKELADGSNFCPGCGSAVNSAQLANPGFSSNPGIPIKHDLPKCTCCGHIGEWKTGPLFRPMDYVIGIGLLFLGFVPGLVYMGVVGLIRYDKKNREKICVSCNARNLFTYIY